MTTAIDPASRGQDWAGYNGGRDSRRSSGGPGHDLSKLQAAVENETAQLTQFTTVDVLLDKAQQCNQRVPMDVEFKRPDRAYIEWLKSDRILVLLSKHSNFPYLQDHRKSLYLVCRKKHEAQRPMFEEITDILRLGPVDTGPRYRPPSAGWDGSRPSSQHSNGPVSMPDVDPLVSRFSKLRTQPPATTRLPYPTEEDAMRIPSGNSSPRNSLPLRPSGPRQMPSSQPSGPPHPPKEPQAQSALAQFPRAPSPVYSPARNIPAPPSVKPPRTTARSASTSSARSSQSNPPQLVKYNGSYGQLPPQRAPTVPERSQPPLPQATKITPKDLHHVFKSGYRVLVIDVRARELFDEGHIHTRNIVCIDPLGLRYGMSFEDLIDSLVLSPDSERDLLEQIGQFDLVVFYDETTSSDSFLQGGPKNAQPAGLRCLYDTLVEFNERHPLRQSPELLAGGLDGWMDLVGPQALQTSNTTGIPAARRLPMRPARRISIANNNSSLAIQQRRMQRLTHLTPEERREFMQLTEKEQVSEPGLNDSSSDAGSDSNQLSVETIRTYDDFFRRFPSIKQQSMTSARPIQQRPPQQAPQPPPPVPPIPSRPPPTVSRPSYSGVSERDPAQGSMTRQQGAQPPLYVSRIVSHAYRLPRTGLKNFAATCYMNATIQCLLATTPLLAFFLNDGYRASVQKNPNGSDGIMPEVFANLLRGLWRNVDSVVRPITLQKLGGRLRQDLFQDVGQQQDAKEYLDFLIGTLHDDLNINFHRSQLRALTDEEEQRREQMHMTQASKIEWDRWQHTNQSPISHFFQGQHASRLRCLTCNATSTKYEPFMSIEVAVPANESEAQLTDCLREYTKEEELSEGEEWRCPRCKCKRRATKRIFVTRMPQILCIHLKRFVNIDGYFRKISTPVRFPLRQLDMASCVASAYQPPPADGSPADIAVTPPFYYEAYAIMRHHGSSMSSGHYTALVRDKFKNVWVDFNDDRVTDLDPNRPLPNSQDSYILFYERSRTR